MADAFPSLTQTTSSTTGTGALVLDTAALSTYLRTPKQAVADGDLTDGDWVYYNVVDKTQVGDALFEVGYGQYNDAANTISRTAGNVISGSNGPGALVSLPASGVRDVLILDHIPQTSSQVAVSNPLRISAAGDVSIGTMVPAVKFHVSDAGAQEITRLQRTDAGAVEIAIIGSAQRWSVYHNNGGFFAILDTTSGNLLPFKILVGAPTDSLVVHSSGKVGAGIAAPATNLHIQESNTDTTPAVEIEQLSTGDAGLMFSIVGDSYAMGIDNSDSDKFKISYAAGAGTAVLGTGDLLRLTTAGVLSDGSDVPYDKFPSGTELLFGTAPPTGWTRVNETNRLIIHLARSADTVGATGGTDDMFDGAWTTNNYTLAEADIPSHNHGIKVASISGSDTRHPELGVPSVGNVTTTTATITSTGGGGPHKHNMATPFYRILARATKN